MEPIVHNIKTMPKGWTNDPFNTYIGRARTIEGKRFLGLYGNPCVIGQKCPICGAIHSDGGSTLPCYEKYLRNRVETELSFKSYVKALSGQHLVCFCKPNPCHGDVLAKVCEELNQENN